MQLMDRSDNRTADALLLLLYIAICAAIILRVTVESTGYTSPDSEYYLEAARSLRDGEKFIIRDLYGLHRGVIDAYVYYAHWPIGYPTLIIIAFWISGLNLFWASKLVNLFFAGLGFLLMRNINRKYSFVLASIYGAFTIIEIYSYTWSECVFIFGCLCLTVQLYKVYLKGKLIPTYSLLAIAGFMFLIRYIGFFAGGAVLLLALITWFENRRRISKHLLIVFSLNVILVCGYVQLNYYLAGYDTNAQRLTEDMESPAQVLWMTVKGITIELFLIRKYYLRDLPDTLTVATTIMQLATGGYLLWLLRKQRRLIAAEIKKNLLSHTAIVVALAYLVVFVFLRSISQFDPPNYRLLAPFTFLMLFAVTHYIVALPDTIAGARQAKYILAGFFLLSLLLNLPKQFLLSQFL